MGEAPAVGDLAEAWRINRIELHEPVAKEIAALKAALSRTGPAIEPQSPRASGKALDRVIRGELSASWTRRPPTG